MDFSKYEGIFNAITVFVTDLMGNFVKFKNFEQYKADLEGIFNAAKALFAKED